MAYRVHEIFYSLQGEGVQAGRPALFCRFRGCNLWSGQEADRAGAVCRFCDTVFVGAAGDGSGEYPDAGALATALAAAWPRTAAALADGERLLVCTGGEPALQLDAALLAALHRRGFFVAVETNGTLPLPPGPDWITVSPKAGTVLRVTAGDELKLVWPQDGLDPEGFATLAFRHFLLQPRDDAQREQHTAACVAWCLQHPRWRLSLQWHKRLGLR